MAVFVFFPPYYWSFLIISPIRTSKLVLLSFSISVFEMRFYVPKKFTILVG